MYSSSHFTHSKKFKEQDKCADEKYLYDARQQDHTNMCFTESHCFVLFRSNKLLYKYRTVIILLYSEWAVCQL